MIIQAFCQALQLRVSKIQSIKENIMNDALEHTICTHANAACKHDKGWLAGL